MLGQIFETCGACNHFMFKTVRHHDQLCIMNYELCINATLHMADKFLLARPVLFDIGLAFFDEIG
ncbi:MAG TPA: hypothetical protein DEO95_08945 [Ruminococcaceae bacterium]|nr:hypothetical protein [Oscillospiraceae bacterium]